MKDHISVSQINMYLGCGLKYRFNYIDEIPKPFKPAALAFGSAIHKALEWIHALKLQEKPVDHEMAIGIFEADWYAMTMDEVRFKTGESKKTMLEKGKNILRAYLSHSIKGNVKAVEMLFEVPLTDIDTGEVLEVPLTGIIDLVEEGDIIVDFKTVARAISNDDLCSNLQLTAYGYAYWHLTKREPTLRMDLLFKTQKPRIERLATIRSQNDYRKLFFIAKEVLKGITSGIFYPNPSWRCNDCEYRSVCWMWQGKFPEEN